MTPAEAAKAKATVQAGIKQLQAAQAATAPAAKKPKA